MSLWIKICANTSLDDALLAAEAGADAVGFVFAPSPRRVTPTETAAIVAHLPASVEKIGVFVNASLSQIYATVRECGLTGVQLHFDADPALPAKLHQRLGPRLRILSVVHFNAQDAAESFIQLTAHDQNPHIDGVLIDSRTPSAVGGTGVAFDWIAAQKTVFQDAKVSKHLIAAGGLNPENVAEAISLLRPWGIDVASGVEAAPGKKDAEKLRAFIAHARAAESASK
jgi:phosphoribosylanthranilate isomerase